MTFLEELGKALVHANKLGLRNYAPNTQRIGSHYRDNERRDQEVRKSVLGTETRAATTGLESGFGARRTLLRD